MHRCCPLCRHDNDATARNAYSSDAWPLKTCAGCGFVYIEKAPVYDELFEEHAWEKSSAAHALRRRQRHPLLQALSKRTRWRLHLFKRRQMEEMLAPYVAEGVVLDVGCGKGTQLRRLPERYTPWGIEISRAEAAHAVDWARGRGGEVLVDSAVGGLERVASGFVAGVFMRSYLEHEAKPARVLQETTRILRPGGVAVIKVPNYGSLNRRLFGKDWCGFRFPDHLNYFTPQTLARMCNQAGLVVRRFRFMDRFPLGDNMWLVAGRD